MRVICFRVDANSKIGQGHAMRCLTLANMLTQEKGAECIFAVSDEESQRFFNKHPYQCLCLENDFIDYSVAAARKLMKILAPYHVVIVLVDSYYMENGYIVALREQYRTACFCCREEVISADVLINYNINYNQKFYSEMYQDSSCRLLLGTDYIPLRPEFKKKEVFLDEKREYSEILVLTGGSDPFAVADKILCSQEQFAGNRVTVVVGQYSRFAGKSLDDQQSDIRIVHATDQVAELMRGSDLAISAGGTTMYELCALGIPSVIYTMADNQVSEAAYMGEKGYVRYVGDIRKDGFWENLFCTVWQLLNQKALLKKMQKKMSSIVDGNGAERICCALQNLWEEY